MDMFSEQAYARAKDFILTHARPLEQHIFAYYFEDGPVDAVFAALAAFQNADGGFGNAMEPDLQLPDSSALATSVGLQVLREFGAAPSHPMVRDAMGYLMQAYDALEMYGPLFPPILTTLPTRRGGHTAKISPRVGAASC